MQAHQWTCKNCSNGYDLAAIEAQLVRAVRLKERAFQLQDLRCTRCRQVGPLAMHSYFTQSCAWGHGTVFEYLARPGLPLPCCKLSASCQRAG